MLVLVGEIEEEGEDGEVADDDDEGGVVLGQHVLVQQVGDPGQEAQGGHISEAGSDGCGNIVWVTFEPKGPFSKYWNHFQYTGEDVFHGKRRIEVKRLFENLYKECTQMIMKNFKVQSYKKFINESLQTFMTELIKIRKLKFK